MANHVHVFDFLDGDQTIEPVCVLFGDEPFLKKLARDRLQERLFGPDDADLFMAFEGANADWKDVVDEVATVSLFGSGSRLAIVKEADPFVKKFRDRLETYVENPKKTGVLLLEVDAWPKNTRLYRHLAKTGLQIECRAPEKSVGSRSVPDEKRLLQWLTKRCKSEHGFALEKRAAEQLLELVGPEFGLLDQEAAKLALFQGEGKITAEQVRDVVGGWRANTIWELIDAAADGDTATALTQLHQLLGAGEHPVALYGQIAWSLRRFAAATRIYQMFERKRQPAKLSEALIQAGFPHWNRRGLARAEAQLKQLGRDRASQLYRWLLEADLALKGTHSSPERSRFVLEHLILLMANRKPTQPKSTR